MWPNNDLFISSLLLIRVKPCHHPVHPVSDGAIGVVVKRVHPRRLEAAIGFNSIPSFPNSSGTHFHRIKPGWRGFLQQQCVSQVCVSKATKYMTEIRCPKE